MFNFLLHPSTDCGRRVVQIAVTFVLAVFLTAFNVIFPEPGTAQLTRKGEVSIKDVTNPRPSVGDITLPMPCNLTMTLRPVGIAVNGKLKDLNTRLGSTKPNTLGFYDRQFPAFIASPLTLADLPSSWRDTVKKQLGPMGNTNQIFFMGKYEVTEAQWQAVMEGCGPLKNEGARPKTNISWYNALNFNEKYTTWLLENSPQSLPSFAGDSKNVGFVRLPTEAEWEYAARGGHAVSSDSLRGESLFPVPEGATAKDYGVFRDGVSPPEKNPLRIGQRRPNPLGLHDTVGNAAEMTSDTFKLTLGGRLHGSPGGFVSKGGSFLSGTDEIMPGSRMETAYFYKDGPTKARDLGFRLVLSAINAPGGQRFETLKKEWNNLGESGVTMTMTHEEVPINPLAAIDHYISKANNDDEKEVLTTIRSQFKDYNAVVERSIATSVLSHVRSMVHAAYGIRNTSLRKIVFTTDIQVIENIIEEANLEIARAKRQGKKQILKTLVRDRDIMAKQQKDMKKAIANFDIALKNQFIYYKILLEDAMAYDRKLLAEQMAFVKQDIKGNDVHAKEMKSCYGYVARDIKFMQKGQPHKVILKNLIISLDKK